MPMLPSLKESFKYTKPEAFALGELPARAATIRFANFPSGVRRYSEVEVDFSALLPAGHPLHAVTSQDDELWTLEIPAGFKSADPLVIDLACAENAASCPRLHLVFGQNCDVELIEVSSGPEGGLARNLILIELKEGAKLRHTRLINAAPNHQQIAFTKVQQAASSHYQHTALGAWAALWRHEIEVSLAGEEAQCQLDAVTLLAQNQHGDLTSRIHHLAPHCTSAQRIRNVLTGQAEGVFQGLIHVAPFAQKTEGAQNCRTLLLSDEASMNSKPELEIFADDVKCGHGNTMGALSDEALFYLRARGIPETEARALLLEGFVAELLDDAAPEARAMAQDWLEVFA